MTTVQLTWLGEALSAAEKQLTAHLGKLLERVVNDAEFLDAVLHAKYSSISFRQPGGVIQVEPSRIVAILRGGHDETEDPANGRLDLKIRRETLAPGLFGVVTPGLNTISINQHFFDACVEHCDYASLVQLLMHEWLHVAGFIHHQDDSAADAAYVVDALAWTFAINCDDDTPCIPMKGQTVAKG